MPTMSEVRSSVRSIFHLARNRGPDSVPPEGAAKTAVNVSELIDLAALHAKSSCQTPSILPFRSESCSSHHFLLDAYGHWVRQIQEQPVWHRKQWEFVYIAQALWERGLLCEGSRGLGFGVGREPLVSLFASRGCKVVATDLGVAQAEEAGWVGSREHASGLASLNERNIANPETFDSLVSYRTCDMNAIDADLTDFDFCWSACCLEHLGSIGHGLDFIRNSLKTLRIGGVAVHTTELNLSSDEDTLDTGGTVLFRRPDLLQLYDALTASGHHVEPFLFHQGSAPVDGFVDVPPYGQSPHLRLQIADYASTSVGIIVRRGV